MGGTASPGLLQRAAEKDLVALSWSILCLEGRMSYQIVVVSLVQSWLE